MAIKDSVTMTQRTDMSTLYLHIGGPKTGSTYLQSVFRMNRSSLMEMGIHYPAGCEYPDSTPTSWTSGNGGGILESPESFRNALDLIKQHPGSSLLYSNEGLRNELCKAEKVAFIPAIAREFGFSRIKVLFFVRDPVAFAVSIWNQMVKNNGMYDTLDERVMNPTFMFYNYKTSEDVLEHLSNNEAFELTALNYSRCSDKLFDVVTDWLGVNGASLTKPEAARINRSLTAAELKLQLAMNKILGGDAKIVSRALTENLTDIRPEKMVPSPDAQQMLWDRVEPMVIHANRYLSPGHEIVFDRQEPQPLTSDQFTFSAIQLEIIGKVVAEDIRNLRYPYIPPPPPAPPPPLPLLSRVWRRLKAVLPT